MATTEKHFTLWSYDVWGNATDGYDVNDRYCQSRDFVVTTAEADGQPTDAELLHALQEAGYIKGNATLADVEFDGEPERIEVTETADGFPLYGLEAN
jgi:hypothetical protein